MDDWNWAIRQLALSFGDHKSTGSTQGGKQRHWALSTLHLLGLTNSVDVTAVASHYFSHSRCCNSASDPVNIYISCGPWWAVSDPCSVDLETVNCIIYYLVSDNFLQMRLAPKLYCARWLVIQSNVLIAVSTICKCSILVSVVSTVINLNMGLFICV